MSAPGKPFKVKVRFSLRYIMRLTEDGFEAECIDAGAVGIGDTQRAAIQDLIAGLEALYQGARKADLKMTLKPREEDEKLYARLLARQNADATVLGFGVIQHMEISTTAAGRKRSLEPRSGFAVSQHVSLAA